MGASWKNPVSGLWIDPTKWDVGGVPNSASTDVFLPTRAGPYTVTSATDETVQFLDVDPGATLALIGGNFTVFSNSVWYSNAYFLGTVDVGPGATLTFGSTSGPSGATAEINGSGTLNIAGSAAGQATLRTLGPWMGLFNGLTVALSGAARIIGAATGSGNVFDNKNTTISGSGTIGNGAASGAAGLILQNDHDGTINANGAAALILDTGQHAISNAGLIETTGTGGLTIASTLLQDGRLVDQSGFLTLKAAVRGVGTLTVGAGAITLLDNGGAALEGLISIARTGKIKTTAGNTTAVSPGDADAGDFLNSVVVNNGQIFVANNSRLNLDGFVYNAGGVLKVGKKGGAASLEVYGGGANINGGTIVLSANANTRIVSNGAGQQLSVLATLHGGGVIGDSFLRLYVGPGGVVNADAAIGLTIVGDTAAVVAGSELANYSAGTVEATGAGGLTLEGGVFGNGGTLIAAGPGALTLNGVQINAGGGLVETTGSGRIVLMNNAVVTRQGQVLVSQGGAISTTSGDTGDAIQTNVVNAGAVHVANGSTLVVDGHWSGPGAVYLDGTASSTAIDIAAGQTWKLVGGGTVKLGDGTGTTNAILSGPGASLKARTYLSNKGDTIVGAGTIGDSFMTITNGIGGTIDAIGAGLTLNSATDTMSLNNAGKIVSDSAAGLTIDDALYNAGELIVNAGARIVAKGAVYGSGLTEINGSGSIEFAAEADNDVYFSGPGGGTLIFDDYGAPTATSPFYGNIYGMGVGDSIDLRDFAYEPGLMGQGANATYGKLDGGLTVTNGSQTSGYLFLEGDYQPADLAAQHLAFTFASDGHAIGATGHTGTLITLVAVAPA